MRYIPIGMLLVYLSNCLVHGSTPVDAAVLAVLACLYGYIEHKTDEKQFTALKTELQEIKGQIEWLKKRDEEVRTHVGSMKLGMNMRTNPLNNKQG